MRIYIFKSEAGNGLHAFAVKPHGNDLPEQHGPWTAIGVVPDDKPPPHRLSRPAIESALAKEGFQLWRMKPKAAR